MQIKPLMRPSEKDIYVCHVASDNLRSFFSYIFVQVALPTICGRTFRYYLSQHSDEAVVYAKTVLFQLHHLKVAISTTALPSDSCWLRLYRLARGALSGMRSPCTRTSASERRSCHLRCRCCLTVCHKSTYQLGGPTRKMLRNSQ